MFSIFVLFILQHLLDSYLLSCLSIGAEVDNSEGSFACDTLYLIFAQDVMRFIFLINRDAIFGKFIRLCFKWLVVMGRFV